MTIKSNGGIFGRNPTFNNVTVDGTLTVYQIVEKTGAAGITLDGVTLKDGNVVLANGKGVDFSATSGTGTSELFDDYEEGYHVVTATPETSGTLTLDTDFDRDTFRYTKLGQRVFVSGALRFLSVSSPVGSWFSVSLPFAVANVGGFSDRSAGVAYQGNTGTSAAVTLSNGASVALVRIDASTIVSGSTGQIFINFDYVT